MLLLPLGPGALTEIYNLVKKPTAAASASTADVSASASQTSTARAPTLRGPDYFSGPSLLSARHFGLKRCSLPIIPLLMTWTESARGPQGSKTVDLKAPPPPPGANGESCAC